MSKVIKLEKKIKNKLDKIKSKVKKIINANTKFFLKEIIEI